MNPRTVILKLGGGAVAASLMAGGAGYLVQATAAHASAPTSPAPATAASADHWPTWIEGRPKLLDAGGTNGWYFWHDAEGLHIRTTTPSDKSHAFTAVLTSAGTFTDVQKVKLEGADDVVLSHDGHTLTVKFHTYDGIDGVNLRLAGGEGMTLRFAEGGHRLDASNIFAGLFGVHPESNPFHVSR